MIDHVQPTDYPIHEACPSCGSMATRVVYNGGTIPSHSCLLMASRDEALEYPAAQLELSACSSCGFVFNRCWDRRHLNYSVNYEETQHFSAHFDNFARALAADWVRDYDLAGRKLLEIGCGKGEFLSLMCREGNCEGIGIDPGVIPERLDHHAQHNIRFLREYYSAEHAKLEADAIICRHTLEHIFDVGPFVRQLRQTIGERRDVVVLFELPDMRRVLRECAFQDIYYEHCSYFSAGSLARLFRSSGFDVTDLQRVYHDQYLILAAVPADSPTAASLPLEFDHEDTLADIARFEAEVVGHLDGWRERLAACSGRTVIWGAGSKCVAFLTTLGNGDDIDYVVDINPHKQGKYLPGTGHRVCSPEDLSSAPPETVVVMNPAYEREIRDTLSDLGMSPRLLLVE